jgi:hypothetical protein
MYSPGCPISLDPIAKLYKTELVKLLMFARDGGWEVGVGL